MKVKIYLILLLMIFFGLSYYIYLIKFSNNKLIINEKVIEREITVFDKNESFINDNEDIHFDENNIVNENTTKSEIVEKNKTTELIVIEEELYTDELILSEESSYTGELLDDNNINLTEILPFSEKPYGMDIDFGNGYYYENNTFFFELREGEYSMKLLEKKIEFFINDINGENTIKIIEEGKEYEILNYGVFARSPQGVFNIKEYENGDLLLAEIVDTHYPKNFVYYTADKGFININDEINKLVSNPFPGNTIKKLGRNLIIESLSTFDVGEKESYKILLSLNTYNTKLLNNK